MPSDRYQGMAAADLIVRNGGRNVGVIYEDSPYGYGLAFSFIAAFTPRKLNASFTAVLAAYGAGLRMYQPLRHMLQLRTF